jgi:hypothetical protein
MKRQLLMLMVGIMFLPALAMAAAPDFSGSWARDNANSDPAPSTRWLTMSAGTGGGGGGRGAAPAGAPGNAAAPARGNAPAGGGRGFAPPAILTVHQDANKLQVVSQGVSHDYMLDGKPHTVPTDTGIEHAEITANVQGDMLVIETTEPYGGMPGNATLNVKEAWSLSPDGNTLTITTTRDVPAEKQTFKQVYNKTQAQPDSICSAGCITPH